LISPTVGDLNNELKKQVHLMIKNEKKANDSKMKYAPLIGELGELNTLNRYV
jgi:hypothetical protein